MIAQDPVPAAEELPPLPPPPLPPDSWPSATVKVSAPIRITFFPPTAPQFGAPIREGASQMRINGRLVEPPAGLGDFVGENFYSALSTRLTEGSVAKSCAARLESYRATRTGLLNELYDQLRLLEFAEDADRDRALRELAASQSSRIAALERDAEELRDELVRGSLFQVTADWNELRSWKLTTLPANPPARMASAEFQVLRAASYFSRGFTPEQRGLLRELAMEQQDRLSSYRQIPGPRSSADPYAMFFSPETTRLRLPKNLPPELSAKIGLYNHDKTELKNELRDAVVTKDGSTPFNRTRYFAALAERQRSRLAALGVLAEEIRRGFAGLPKPPPPVLPPNLPPELLADLKAYRRDQLALNSARSRMTSDAIRVPVPANPNLSGLARIREMSDARLSALRRAREQFQLENADRIAELQERGLALRKRVDTIAAVYLDPASGRPMNAVTLMRAWDAADQQFAQIGREEAIYKDYNIAMLMPGLSPEQRRLLFGAALVALAQPLPGPERLPPPSP